MLHRSCLASVLVVLLSLIQADSTHAQHTISGQVRYYTSNAALPGVSIDLLGDTPQSTLTNSNGEFSFPNVAPGNWLLVPSKQNDVAGSITSLDASLELQGAVGIYIPTAMQVLACDTEASGTLSAIDGSHILRYRVGLAPDMPSWTSCGTEWIFVPQPADGPGLDSMPPQPHPAPTPCDVGSIQYTGLSGSQINQDFLAILNGDCSGDWPAVLSPTPSRTATVTGTPTHTGTVTSTPTVTATLTPTNTPSITATRSITATPSLTPPLSSTPTRTPTITPTPTRSGTSTRTGTTTRTPTITPIFGIPWPQITVNTAFSSLGSPVYVDHANNGDGVTRTFIVLQTGIIRLVRNGVLQATPLLDIGSSGANRISCCGEQGLLSTAFPPGYAGKRYFYVNYTRASDGATVVARYHLQNGNNDVADVNSEQILLTVAQPFSNHNGGQLAFGPDGYLYIGMGDGGSGGDPGNRAQNSTTLLGKMLRIDTESVAATTTPTYAIPNNPTPNPTFTATPGYRREIWAHGLRNPWRFSFDRLTGDMYIGDVGQGTLEEIDFQPANSAGGENYGWRLFEGSSQFDCPMPCSSTGLTMPVVEYGHVGGNCSVTGGFVYRGTTYPCMHGTYFYADYCSGRIWGARHDGSTWQSQQLMDAPYNITCFGEDASGNLYVCDATNSQLRLVTDSCVAATLTPGPSGTPTPTPSVTPTPTITPTSSGFSLRFFGTGTGDIDRVKLPIDPNNGVDVDQSFTLEWWMRAVAGANNSGSCPTGNDNWITGNILFDRDVFGGGDFGDYGVSLHGGVIAFGVHNGSSGNGICGTVDLADSTWHHVAVTRNGATGGMCIYVDGQLDGSCLNGPAGSISYRNGRTTSFPGSDPFLVIGAEKHDAGASFPSFAGWIDEVRLSNNVRYSSNFSVPSLPLSADANTVLLLHLDEGSGTNANDVSSSNVDGTLMVGGVNNGPQWSTDHP